MKKLKIAVLVLMLCLVITGCGCSKKSDTYTVKFDSDGGSKVTTQEVKKGDSVEEPNDPTKKGYIFDGWYVEDEEYDFNSKVTKGITLKAKWIKKSTSKNACNMTCATGYELVNPDSKDCSCKKKASQTVTKTENSGISQSTSTTKDEKLNSALASIDSITLTKGNTSLAKSYTGCSISNIENSVSNNASSTVIEGDNVKKLYRPKTDGTITSTYSVTCDSNTATKTVVHKIKASDYTYTVSDNNVVYIIKVNNATNYTLNGNLKYRSTLDGVQTGLTNYKSGTVYKMVFDNDLNTIYEVKEA